MKVGARGGKRVGGQRERAGRPEEWAPLPSIVLRVRGPPLRVAWAHTANIFYLEKLCVSFGTVLLVGIYKQVDKAGR